MANERRRRGRGGRRSLTVPFSKMHGLGNDFVVIDRVTRHVPLTDDHIRFLADRHFGVGCDQVLLVDPPDGPDADFRYRIFNADGSEVEQCGNGARCFARFVHDKQLTHKDRLRVETARGLITLTLERPPLVQVEMGTPVFTPESVPFRTDQPSLTYDVSVDGFPVSLSVLSLGNPHAVMFVEDTENAPVTTLGPRLETHPDFPNRVNVGFAQVIDRTELRLRVWERGVGETLACGSGACAAVVAGRRRDLLDARVKVHLPGGHLWVEWPGEDQPVTMKGPAVRVFDGTIPLRV